MCSQPSHPEWLLPLIAISNVMESLKEELKKQASELREIKELLKTLLSNITPENSQMVDIKGAAKITKLRPATIYKLKASEKIPYHKRQGSKKIMFSVIELQSWLSRKDNPKITSTDRRKTLSL